jgi:hypothetical protein
MKELAPQTHICASEILKQAGNRALNDVRTDPPYGLVTMTIPRSEERLEGHREGGFMLTELRSVACMQSGCRSISGTALQSQPEAYQQTRRDGGKRSVH